MRALTLLALLIPIVLASMPIKIDMTKYAMVIYRLPGGKLQAAMISKAQMPSALSSLRGEGAYVVRVIHFYKIRADFNLSDIKPLSSTMLPYSEKIGNIGLSWQLDSNHLNVGQALTTINKAGAAVDTEVAVIDSGVAPLSSYSNHVDYSKAYAITAFITLLNSTGICDEAGTYDFSNVTVTPDLSFYNFENYTFPAGSVAKYCLVTNLTKLDNVFGSNFGTALEEYGVTAVAFIQLTNPQVDVVGHGTFVTSQIIGAFDVSNETDSVKLMTGINPNLTVIPIKADYMMLLFLNANGTTLSELLANTTAGQRYLIEGIFDDSSLQEAANYIASLASKDPKLKVVNMSLGGYASYGDFLTECYTEIEPMQRAGVIVVAAAGNEGDNINELNSNYGLYDFPAQCRGVVAVSALDVNNTLASFSNYGTLITFGAPGEDNIGAYWKGSIIGQFMAAVSSVLTYIYLYNGTDYYLTQGSGTSYAAPLVSGALALMASFTNQPLSALKSASKDPFGASFNPYTGYGVPNVGKAVYALLVGPKSNGTGSQVLENATANASSGIPALSLLPVLATGIFRRVKKSLKK